jgi:high-affinity iron transporter
MRPVALRFVGVGVACQLALGASLGRRVAAQERPAKRLANIVGVAVEEYGKGVDASGRLVSQLEYDEAVAFLGDAREVAGRLSGERADSARILLDSLISLVGRRVPPSELQGTATRFVAMLGADGALDLPSKPVDLEAGERLYATHCASCHGARGMGDGPLASGMDPPPPALGSPTEMHDRTPALLFRVLSVGVAGTPMAGWGSSLSVDERWSIISYLSRLRAPGPLAEGEGIYLQRCAGCHGVKGASDGIFAAGLSRLPVELSSFAWQAERSDAQIARVVKEGVPGTAMPAAPDLREREVASVVAYVRTLSLSDAPAGQGGVRRDPRQAARLVMGLLDEALAAARAGRGAEAGDRAFDAYLAFEPLETPARARDPGLVASLERHFADFKGAVRQGDLRAAERARNAIEQGMPSIVALAGSVGGKAGAFLQSFLIILREGFEAILVIGAVVAFLLKTGHRERLRSIWWGAGIGLVASAVTAVLLQTVLRALPASREVIEGTTMLLAVAVLFSVSYWLISKVDAARWQQFIREKVDAALSHGGGAALAAVAFLAVYREGAETALFFQALLHEGSGNGGALLAGLLVGALALGVVFTLFYRYGIRIRLRPFFGVTSLLLYWMAFVFMGKGLRELQEGNIVPITPLPGWPHIEVMGIFPSVETLLGQGLLLGLFIFAVVKTFWPRRAVVLPTIPAGAAIAPVGAAEGDIARRLDQLERRLEAVERVLSAEIRPG